MFKLFLKLIITIPASLQIRKRAQSWTLERIKAENNLRLVYEKYNIFLLKL